MKRIFILGPAGSERKDYATRVKDQFNLTLIETSDLLNKEAAKDSADARRIQSAQAQGCFGKFTPSTYFS